MFPLVEMLWDRQDLNLQPRIMSPNWGLLMTRLNPQKARRDQGFHLASLPLGFRRFSSCDRKNTDRNPFSGFKSCYSVTTLSIIGKE